MSRGSELNRILSGQSDLETLIVLFHEVPASVGTFVPVDGSNAPEPARGLLDHNEHMTVTVERFHQSPVRVEILQSVTKENWYCREILLRRESDDRAVQYGIVRLNLSLLSESVRVEILARKKPLGRVLIEYNVLREVRLRELYQVTPGPVLQRVFSISAEDYCYGRTAIIDCDAVPAIELLEIVPPAS